MPRCGTRASALLASHVLWSIWWTPLELAPQPTLSLTSPRTILWQCFMSEYQTVARLSIHRYSMEAFSNAKCKLNSDSRHGPSFVPDAQEVIAKSSYSCADDGTEMYDINGFRIIQAADGLVKVTRQHNKGLIRTSPGNGSVTLTTIGIHCTASLGKTSHLFLR